jgi:hypothetical protein
MIPASGVEFEAAPAPPLPDLAGDVEMIETAPPVADENEEDFYDAQVLEERELEQDQERDDHDGVVEDLDQELECAADEGGIEVPERDEDIGDVVEEMTDAVAEAQDPFAPHAPRRPAADPCSGDALHISDFDDMLFFTPRSSPPPSSASLNLPPANSPLFPFLNTTEVLLALWIFFTMTKRFSFYALVCYFSLLTFFVIYYSRPFCRCC